jgi:drug/metabolite transporter (DMT)-like permease
MNIIPSVLAVSSAIGFKAVSLTERYLQESKASPLTTFALHRYALIPAIIWSVIFIDAEDISQILKSPTLVTYFLLIALMWNVQVFLTSYILNTTSSMSELATLRNLISLPLYLLIGIVVNHDIPNLFSIGALVLLGCALVIQPTQHQDNVRARYSLPLIVIATVIVLQACLDGAGNGLYRAIVQEVSPEVLLGVFSVTTIGLCAALSWLLPGNRNDSEIIRKSPGLAVTVPLLWFAASIPEVYAYAALPIYTILSISAITFAMDTLSDVFQRRISFNARTASFIVLVLSGIGLAVYSA